jgi:hypothetical protein
MNEHRRTVAAPAAAVPNDPAVVYGRRGFDGRYIDVPARSDGNSVWVPEAPRDGLAYVRNGRDGMWLPAESGAVWIGPDPPVNATPGTLWWRNDPDGNLYILVQNPGGGGLHWVPASSTSGGGVNPLPPGGTIGQILVKRSAADSDAGWLSQGLSFVGTGRVTITGNEIVNARIGTLTIPPNQLPNVPFWWTCEGQGVGHIFLFNPQPGDGVVSAGNIAQTAYSVGTGSGGQPDSILGSITVSSGSFGTTTKRLIRGTGGSTALFHYDPAVNTAGIEVYLSVSLPVTACVYSFGIEGQIVGLG